MTHAQPEEPVHVTEEERPHPALRKLGRACIALARWLQEQERMPNAPTGPDTKATPVDPAPTAEEERSE